MQDLLVSLKKHKKIIATTLLVLCLITVAFTGCSKTNSNLTQGTSNEINQTMESVPQIGDEAKQSTEPTDSTTAIDDGITETTEVTEETKPVDEETLDETEELNDITASDNQEDVVEPSETTQQTDPQETTTSKHESKPSNPEKPNQEKEEDPPKSTNPPSSQFDYVGRFKIKSVGVNVACYATNAQSAVDAEDSAAYFYATGHAIIGDHKHQGFNAIKSCTKGTVATLETPNGTRTYKCVGKINGHNTGTILTDANGTSIKELYPGTLVCYTCNDNWKNVTIVFFSDTDVEYDDKGQPIGSEQSCNEGYHGWGEWMIAWEVINSDGKYYGWDKRICQRCGEEEWVMREEPSPDCEIPPVPEQTEPEEEQTESPVEPEPTETPTETPAETPVETPTEGVPDDITEDTTGNDDQTENNKQPDSDSVQDETTPESVDSGGSENTDL